MKKFLAIMTVVVTFAIAFNAYTRISTTSHPTGEGAIAMLHEIADRDDHEMGYFRLAKFCELGLNVPNYSLSACEAAYYDAHQRAEFSQALHFATLGCLRDNDGSQCAKAAALVARKDDGGGEHEAIVTSVPVARLSETVDGNEWDLGYAGLSRFCELGLTVPGHSLSACQFAYIGAYQRGQLDEALRYANVACERNKKGLECRKASILTAMR
jgi:hypothetical protein